jgi:EAL domain-containing protein (putative c-di-GMP-specific phosphodiesterase class I)
MVEERLTNPLVAQFRRGGVPTPLRLMAAQGLLPLGSGELVELWTDLVDDPDGHVRGAATASLLSFPVGELLPILRNPGTSTAVRSWVATHRKEPRLRKAARAGDAATTRGAPTSSPPEPPSPSEPDVDLGPAFATLDQAMGHYLSEPERSQPGMVDALRKIHELDAADRLVLALKGSRQERALLVRDPNRLVASAALGSPKTTEAEAESFSAMTNVSDHILRDIGRHPVWTKRYAVVRNLVRNPRTPIGIALPFVPRLNARDLKAVSSRGPRDTADTESFAPEQEGLLMRLAGLVAQARRAVPPAKRKLGVEERRAIFAVIERAEATLERGGLDVLRGSVEEMADALHVLEQARGTLPSETLPLPPRKTPAPPVIPAQKLQELLREEQVTMVFQPIVTLPVGTVVGYEALGRGHHLLLPEGPLDLFPIAASVGAAAELSRLFRRKAVELARRRRDLPTIFLNTHPSEFAEPGLLASLEELRASAPDLSLAVEIHESAVAGPGQIATMHGFLTDRGMILVYDGFGAGQSRLVELAENPPGYLKFDGRLVRGLDQAPVARRKFLTSLLTVARDLRVKTVAVGVETAAEAQACAEAGFTHGQGVYLGRPRPMEQI